MTDLPKRDDARSDIAWIQTYTGRRFWPLDARAKDVAIEDIAHALSLKCRYTGHTTAFYSVAQHSVLVAQNCQTLEEKRWGLLHDATEAYLPDIARPIKDFIEGFRTIEDTLMGVIAERFGLKGERIPKTVKHWDVVLLATESRDMMPRTPEPWWEALDVPTLGPITPLAPEEAERKFLEAFALLFPGEEFEWGGPDHAMRYRLQVVREQSAAEDLAEATKDLMEIIEGVRERRWAFEGERLKDQPEWCSFYSAWKNYQRQLARREQE